MKASPKPIVQIERVNGTIVVSFSSTVIDNHNFERVADELEEIIRSPNPQALVIDLTGVHRLDELGLAVLQSLQESVKDVGGTTRFRGPTDQIEQAVGKTRLARDISDRHSLLRPPQWTRW